MAHSCDHQTSCVRSVSEAANSSGLGRSAGIWACCHSVWTHSRYVKLQLRMANMTLTDWGAAGQDRTRPSVSSWLGSSHLPTSAHTTCYLVLGGGDESTAVLPMTNQCTVKRIWNLGFLQNVAWTQLNTNSFGMLIKILGISPGVSGVSLPFLVVCGCSRTLNPNKNRQKQNTWPHLKYLANLHLMWWFGHT